MKKRLKKVTVQLLSIYLFYRPMVKQVNLTYDSVKNYSVEIPTLLL